jgi:transposase
MNAKAERYQIAMIPKDGRKPKMLAFTYSSSEAQEVAEYLREEGHDVFLFPRRRAHNRHDAANLLRIVRAMKAGAR